MREFFFILVLCVSSSFLNAQKKSCFESVVVPDQYEIVQVQDPIQPSSTQRLLVPKTYRFDTTYVEQIPTGRPNPTAPKQYKMVISRVPEPCLYEEDEEGNCYKTADILYTPKIETKRQKIPCAYELSAAGECIRKLEVLCPEAIKCKTRKSIQTALLTAGYQPGKGKKAFSTTTMAALNSFQTDNNLPTAGITMESLKMLLKK